ncbi:MAG: hypothetical protein ACLTSM_08940 [Eubacterium sp.]
MFCASGSLGTVAERKSNDENAKHQERLPGVGLPRCAVVVVDFSQLPVVFIHFGPFSTSLVLNPRYR